MLTPIELAIEDVDRWREDLERERDRAVRIMAAIRRAPGERDLSPALRFVEQWLANMERERGMVSQVNGALKSVRHETPLLFRQRPRLILPEPVFRMAKAGGVLEPRRKRA